MDGANAIKYLDILCNDGFFYRGEGKWGEGEGQANNEYLCKPLIRGLIWGPVPSKSYRNKTGFVISLDSNRILQQQRM